VFGLLMLFDLRTGMVDTPILMASLPPRSTCCDRAAV